MTLNNNVLETTMKVSDKISQPQPELSESDDDSDDNKQGSMQKTIRDHILKDEIQGLPFFAKATGKSQMQMNDNLSVNIDQPAFFLFCQIAGK